MKQVVSEKLAGVRRAAEIGCGKFICSYSVEARSDFMQLAL